MNEARKTNGSPAEVAALVEQLGPFMDLWQRVQAQQGPPITDPRKVLIKRDKDGHRIPIKRRTPLGLEIEFKPLTEGERRSYESFTQGETFLNWPVEDQVRLVNENLVKPDFKKEAGGDLTPEWVGANFDWQTFSEIGTEIIKGSRLDFRVPRLDEAEGQGKKGRGRRTASTARSSTPSSTRKATPTQANGASTT